MKAKKIKAKPKAKRRQLHQVPKRRQLLAPALKRAAKQAEPLIRKAIAEAASKIPADIKAPGFGVDRGSSWIKPGRYVMRNGSAAIVVEPVTLKFGVMQRQTWHGWKGHLDGHPNGEGLTWSLDGKRSDATPAHEHDLIKRHKNQTFTCSGCGCTDARACRGGCSWVAPTRCSACFPAVLP